VLPKRNPSLRSELALNEAEVMTKSSLEKYEIDFNVGNCNKRRVSWKNMLFARLVMVKAIFPATIVVVSIAKGQGN
jgi:hypothetical protein